MKIPQKIEIQIIDIENNVCEKEILMGIKIYKDSETYYNFSPFKTEMTGKCIINQNQIAKHIGEFENPNNFSPKKIEIEIWNCEVTNSFVKAIKNMESITEKNIKLDLLNRGFNDNTANSYSKLSVSKIKNDFESNAKFLNVQNCVTQFIDEKIYDNWIDESEKLYQFRIK